jgi:hypothetical protein
VARIKRCNVQEVMQVGHVCGQAFGVGIFGGIDNSALQALECKYITAVEREVKEKLMEALSKKSKVCESMRQRK